MLHLLSKKRYMVHASDAKLHGKQQPELSGFTTCAWHMIAHAAPPAMQ